MKVKIKRIEDRAIIPSYANKGDAGFDLHSIDTINVPADGTVRVRTGLTMAIPEGYELQIRPRSGLSFKSKIRISNSPGTIDSGYRGEILILVDNISQNGAEAYRINAGDRIAQGVLKPIVKAEFEEVDDLDDDTERGTDGFGSSGD